MVYVRVHRWGLSYEPAEYYGWRHSLHIGPLLLFWGLMSEAELIAWDEARNRG